MTSSARLRCHTFGLYPPWAGSCLGFRLLRQQSIECGHPLNTTNHRSSGRKHGPVRPTFKIATFGMNRRSSMWISLPAQLPIASACRDADLFPVFSPLHTPLVRSSESHSKTWLPQIPQRQLCQQHGERANRRLASPRLKRRTRRTRPWILANTVWHRRQLPAGRSCEARAWAQEALMRSNPHPGTGAL